MLTDTLSWKDGLIRRLTPVMGGLLVGYLLVAITSAVSPTAAAWVVRSPILPIVGLPLAAIGRQSVDLAYVDQGYRGEETAETAAEHGIRLEVVKHAEAKRGFVLLPRRWVVERSFAWAARCRRLDRDYERLPETLAGLHFVAFACLMLARFVLTTLSS